MTTHAKLSASASHRWMPCPGSVTLSEPLPKSTSAAASEGTDAHHLAEMCLTTDTNAVEYLGTTLPEGHVVGQEMADAVQLYVDTVRNDVENSKHVWVEIQFSLEKIHPNMFGTNDACVYVPSKKKLIVYDYKHGAGILVEVENNPQLMYYGVGALFELKLPVEIVELVIVQPRREHEDGLVRRWSIPAIDLLEWVSLLKERAIQADSENAPLSTGEHCRFCPAAAICPEIHKIAMQHAHEEFSPTTYDTALLAKNLEHADILKNWASSVKKFAYNEALRGRIPPGFKVIKPRKYYKLVPESAKGNPVPVGPFAEFSMIE